MTPIRQDHNNGKRPRFGWSAGKNALRAHGEAIGKLALDAPEVRRRAAGAMEGEVELLAGGHGWERVVYDG